MADEGEESGGGGGSKKLIIIIVAVIVLLLIAAAAWFFLQPKGEEEIVPDEKISSSAEPLAAPIFLNIDTFVVNLKDGRRYLKTTIQLMLSEQKASDYLNGRLVEVKDIVLSELQELSTEDIKMAEARNELKQRLISRISTLFPTKHDWEDPEPIKKVLFQEFFIQ
ncbi:MAG: flagellar basal body-associated FliL family protein [SAR324 cluster bacterium]|nr:flagellar basal body-associated FliL family protein [SAR324 cluster bacterium]